MNAQKTLRPHPGTTVPALLSIAQSMNAWVLRSFPRNRMANALAALLALFLCAAEVARLMMRRPLTLYWRVTWGALPVIFEAERSRFPITAALSALAWGGVLAWAHWSLLTLQGA